MQTKLTKLDANQIALIDKIARVRCSVRELIRFAVYFSSIKKFSLFEAVNK